MSKTIEKRLDALIQDNDLTTCEGFDGFIIAHNEHGIAIIEIWNAAIEAMKHTRNNLTALIEQSDGLAGYHLNGAIAEWDYFEEDDWLGLEQLQRAIVRMEGHSPSRDEAMVEDKGYERDDIYKK